MAAQKIFTLGAVGDSFRPDMDKFWSIFAMPIGVMLCFGPALVVWWLTEGAKAHKEKSKDRR